MSTSEKRLKVFFGLGENEDIEFLIKQLTSKINLKLEEGGCEIFVKKKIQMKLGRIADFSFRKRPNATGKQKLSKYGTLAIVTDTFAKYGLLYNCCLKIKLNKYYLFSSRSFLAEKVV